jgi:mannosyltransferase
VTSGKVAFLSWISATARVPVHDLGLGVLVFAAALGIYGLRLEVPDPGQDESATVAVAGRAFPDLAAAVWGTDLVHGAYSFLAHVALVLAGPFGWPEIAVMRTVSAVAMALGAAMLVPLGARLGGRAAGVTAGLVLAVHPLASRYAQEAGPWALVTLGTTVASWALLRACQMRARSGWVVYAAAIAATAVLDMLSLLVVVAHGGYLLTGPLAAWRRWLLSVAGAVVVLTPFLIATSVQQRQLSGRGRMDLAGLDLFFSAQIGSTLAVPLVTIGFIIGALILRRRPGWRMRMDGDLVILGLFWAILPPLLLGGISLVHPLGDGRHLIFTLPGLALALGTLAASLPVRVARSKAGWWSSRRALGSAASAVLIVAMLAGGWSQQVAIRDAGTGHREDLWAAAAFPGGSGPGQGRRPVPAERPADRC